MSTRRRGDVYNRAQIADFICPDNGVRGAMKRKGIKPKDHMKENLMQIRDSQRANREQREEGEREPRELYKLSQFRNVDSRVYETKVQPYKETDGDYLARGAGQQRRTELTMERRQIRAEVERRIEEARQISDNPLASPRKAPVPKDDGVLMHKDINFIASNRVNAQLNAQLNVHSLSNARSPADESTTKHSAYGRNPKYLQVRKQQWEEEKLKKKLSAPDPDCPKGMKLMPEDERLSTLDSLQTSKTECLRLLTKLPFVLDTISSKKKQEVYENKLKEIENAISIFKRPKVFIKKD